MYALRANVTFDDSYRERWTRAVRLAYVMTGSASLAEDLAREAFVSLHGHSAGLDRPVTYLPAGVAISATV